MPSTARTGAAILVVRRPASGTTTLARTTAARLELPLLAKDDLKELLFTEHLTDAAVEALLVQLRTWLSSPPTEAGPGR